MVPSSVKTKSDLHARFARHCRRRQFFSAGDRVLIAVSGGADSMVLLHLMQSLAHDLEMTVAVGHVHHRLRGTDAQRDLEFVQRYCRSHGIRFHSRKVQTKHHAKTHRLSIEEAARRLRYAALRSWAARWGYTVICTAHHRSDQAETVLMRALKGTGIRGLSGIRETTQDLVRPLLPFSREEILAFAHAHHLPYRSDPSNADNRFLRNRLRSAVLPSIRRHVDPQADQHLAGLAQIAEYTYRYLRTQAESEFTRICTASPRRITLDIEMHRDYFLSLFATLYELIFEKLVPDRTLDMHDIESLHRLYDGAEAGRRLIIGPVTCLKDRNRIVFTLDGIRSPGTLPRRVFPDRTYRWKDFVFHSQTVDMTTYYDHKGRSPLSEYIDSDSVTGHLVLRPWKIADRFYPIGLGGSKRVSDLLTDLKVSPLDRKHVRVLAEQSHGSERIIWVCGYRLDDRFKVTDRTTAILECQCDYGKNN